MNYSVCLPAVLSRLPQSDALAAVKEAGYARYEIWDWCHWDLEELLRLQKVYGLSIAALCTADSRLNDPQMRETYLDGLRRTVPVCKRLGCKTVITQVGQECAHLSRLAQHASIVAGLKACVPILEEAGLTLVFEPLNTRIDHKGYYLWSAKEAFEIQAEVGSDRVKVLYDLYHQYAMEDLDLEEILANIGKIGHFHMAGYPGRHEPLADSEIDYMTILKAIQDTGYSGCIGLEYLPVQDPVQGLKELRSQLI